MWQQQDVRNLIQIMEGLGVKYLGTMKDSKAFPFSIVDLNELKVAVENNRPIVQGYGTRTSFTARKGNTTATVMRHGAGRVRAARAASNMLERQRNV